MSKIKLLLTPLLILLVFLVGSSLAIGSVKAADPFIAYAWNAYRSTTSIPEGAIKLEIPDGDINLLLAESKFFMSGGDFVGPTLYMVSYPEDGSSNLYTIDTATGLYTLVGKTNSELQGFTYDVSNGIAYGNSLTDLYSIDLTTGNSTLIGPINNNSIIGIACDADGNLYGIDINDNNLYSINKLTGAGTIIGNLEMDIIYAQDIGFNRETGKLYGTLYTNTGGLYEIDVNTGTATLLNYVSAELDAFAIPYNLSKITIPAPTNISVTGITLNTNNLSFNNVGISYQLIGEITPTNATIKDIIWTSTNEKVAKVSDTGLVIPLIGGTTAIRATTLDGQFVAETTITVRGVLPQTGLMTSAFLLSLLLIGTGATLVTVIVKRNK